MGLNKPQNDRLPEAAKDTPRFSELQGSLLMIRPDSVKKDDFGNVDKGKFDCETVVSTVHVLKSTEEDFVGKTYTGMWISGKRITPVLLADVGTGEWTVAKYKVVDKAQVLTDPTDAEYELAEKALAKVDGTPATAAAPAADDADAVPF